MINPFLNNAQIDYTLMTAIGWILGSSSSDGSPSIFEGVGGRVLADKLRTISSDRCLVVNCNGISLIDEHALSYAKDEVGSGKKLILFFDESHNNLENEIKQQLSSPNNSFHFDDRIIAISFNMDGASRENIALIIAEAKSLQVDKIKQIVRNSWKQFDHGLQRLSSTPVKSNGLFNARAIISDPEQLLWCSISLADIVKDIIVTNRLIDHCLLAVSLRGSPLAAATWFLTSQIGTKVEIVDHIGPIHEILEEPTFGNQRGSGNYIYIADFIIGGTELKVAKSYAWSKGKRLEHAVALGTLLNPTEYDEKGRLKIFGLTVLRECCPDIIYEFL